MTLEISVGQARRPDARGYGRVTSVPFFDHRDIQDKDRWRLSKPCAFATDAAMVSLLTVLLRNV